MKEQVLQALRKVTAQELVNPRHLARSSKKKKSEQFTTIDTKFATSHTVSSSYPISEETVHCQVRLLSIA